MILTELQSALRTGPAVAESALSKDFYLMVMRFQSLGGFMKSRYLVFGQLALVMVAAAACQPRDNDASTSATPVAVKASPVVRVDGVPANNATSAPAASISANYSVSSMQVSVDNHELSLTDDSSIAASSVMATDVSALKSIDSATLMTDGTLHLYSGSIIVFVINSSSSTITKAPEGFRADSFPATFTPAATAQSPGSGILTFNFNECKAAPQQQQPQLQGKEQNAQQPQLQGKELNAQQPQLVSKEQSCNNMKVILNLSQVIPQVKQQQEPKVEEKAPVVQAPKEELKAPVTQAPKEELKAPVTQVPTQAPAPAVQAK